MSDLVNTTLSQKWGKKSRYFGWETSYDYKAVRINSSYEVIGWIRRMPGYRNYRAYVLFCSSKDPVAYEDFKKVSDAREFIETHFFVMCKEVVLGDGNQMPDIGTIIRATKDDFLADGRRWLRKGEKMEVIGYHNGDLRIRSENGNYSVIGWGEWEPLEVNE